MARLEFSDHAKQQIKRRGISRKLINQTLDNPETEKLSFRGRRLFQKKHGERILEVVTIKEVDKTIVITAYYL